MSIKKIKSKRFASGEAWEIDLRERGYPRIRRQFPTRELAEQAELLIRADRLRKLYRIPDRDRVTLKQLIEAHLKYIAHRANPERVETVLNYFLTLTGDRPVDLLRVRDIQKYIDTRKRTVTNQTINRELNEISACLNAGWKYFESLEAFRCPRFERLPEPQDGRRQTWSDDEIRAVVRELRRAPLASERRWQIEHRLSVADMFVLAQETGMRMGEARQLHRTDIDLKHGVLVITSRKGKRPKRREIKMNEVVERIVRERLEKCEWLFPSRDRKKPLQSFYKSFAAACERAGIAYGIDKKGGLIANDARRTFVNRALEGQKSVRALVETTGHSIETMARHYARSTPAQKEEIVKTGRQYETYLDADNQPTGPTEELRSEREPKKRQKKRAFAAK